MRLHCSPHWPPLAKRGFAMATCARPMPGPWSRHVLDGSSCAAPPSAWASRPRFASTTPRRPIQFCANKLLGPPHHGGGPARPTANEQTAAWQRASSGSLPPSLAHTSCSVGVATAACLSRQCRAVGRRMRAAKVLSLPPLGRGPNRQRPRAWLDRFFSPQTPGSLPTMRGLASGRPVGLGRPERWPRRAGLAARCRRHGFSTFRGRPSGVTWPTGRARARSPGPDACCRWLRGMTLRAELPAATAPPAAGDSRSTSCSATKTRPAPLASRARRRRPDALRVGGTFAGRPSEMDRRWPALYESERGPAALDIA